MHFFSINTNCNPSPANFIDFIVAIFDVNESDAFKPIFIVKKIW